MYGRPEDAKPTRPRKRTTEKEYKQRSDRIEKSWVEKGGGLVHSTLYMACRCQKKKKKKDKETKPWSTVMASRQKKGGEVNINSGSCERGGVADGCGHGAGSDDESERSIKERTGARTGIRQMFIGGRGASKKEETSRAKCPNFWLLRERKKKKKTHTHKNRTHRYHIYYLDSQAEIVQCWLNCW